MSGEDPMAAGERKRRRITLYKNPGACFTIRIGCLEVCFEPSQLILKSPTGKYVASLSQTDKGKRGERKGKGGMEEIGVKQTQKEKILISEVNS